MGYEGFRHADNNLMVGRNVSVAVNVEESQKYGFIRTVC